MNDLFESSNEWDGMPEFVQEKQEPFSKIIIRFENNQDLQEFAEMIGQKLTNKTKSIWHPKLIRGLNSNKRYTTEHRKCPNCDSLNTKKESVNKYTCIYCESESDTNF